MKISHNSGFFQRAFEFSWSPSYERQKVFSTYDFNTLQGSET